jgi:hypothetical protein
MSEYDKEMVNKINPTKICNNQELLVVYLSNMLVLSGICQMLERYFINLYNFIFNIKVGVKLKSLRKSGSKMKGVINITRHAFSKDEGKEVNSTGFRSHFIIEIFIVAVSRLLVERI